MNLLENDKPELIYVFDPVCGWCYGFTPVMQKIKEKYSDSLIYSVYTGGLVVGDRVGSVQDTFAYVKDAHKRVEEYTGVLFGEGFKKNFINGTQRFNSVPPSKAFVIFKELQPENALDFAHDLQMAINYDGKDMEQPDMYLEIAEKHGIDTGLFMLRFNDAAYDSLLYKDFQMGQYYQANGYPHVLLRKGEQYYLLARGYQPYEQLAPIIEKLMVEPD